MKKALIVYSTWAGSTRAIAERMAETIRQNSHQATVLSAKEEIDVNAFDLIIIGSSIHAGRTIGSFRKFIRRNLKDLCNHPVALFVSCANLMNDNDQTRKETLAWLDSAIKPFSCLQPISKGLFAGAALTEGENYRNLNIFVRRIISAMRKNIVAEYGRDDFRDWEKIDQWTLDLLNMI